MKTLLVSTIIALLLIGTPAQAGALATDAQMAAYINVVDPGHTATWKMRIDPAYDNGSKLGVTTFADETIQLAGGRMPLEYMKTVIRHEFGHIMQWRWIGRNPYQLQPLGDYLSKMVTGAPTHNGNRGLEEQADCVAWYYQQRFGADCYDFPIYTLTARMIADVSAGRVFVPPVH